MRIYRPLTDLREHWGGALVLCCGEHCWTLGTPAAVSVAGGTLLGVHEDSAQMKAGLRAGAFDFVVSNLDEALRTLKNEIRQKRPLSVGLMAGVTQTVAEMVERGVQPELEVTFGDDVCNAELLQRCGMQTLRFSNDDLEPPAPAGAACFFAATHPAKLREIDSALDSILPGEDRVRRRWVRHLPQYLREARSGGRWIWLSEGELSALAEQGITPQQR